jgi:hypothetical protein
VFDAISSEEFLCHDNDCDAPTSGPRRDHGMDGRVKLVNPMIDDFGSVMVILTLVK